MTRLEVTHRYDDIIHLPHPVSRRRTPMSRKNRAAQFAPFAALSGFGDAVAETARLTGRRIELDEAGLARLNEKILLLARSGASRPVVTLTWFEADARKAGGRYVSTTGAVRRVDERMVILADGRRIPLALIDDARGEIFRHLEE